MNLLSSDLLRHGSFHLVRWVWLFVLYAIIVSYTFATLGAWEFQDQIRALVADRASANNVRQQLTVALELGSPDRKDLADRIDELQTALGQFELSAKSAAITSGLEAAKDQPEASPQPVALGTKSAVGSVVQLPLSTGLADQISGLKEELGRFSKPRPLQDEKTLVRLYLTAIDAYLRKNTDQNDKTAEQDRAVGILAEYLMADNLRSPLLTPVFYVPGLEAVPRQLATWSEGYLTLLLTLMMGALGSLLYVTRSFLSWAFKGLRVTEPAPQPVSWFIFRPMFGAITALAILILVKAGQLTFSSGTTFSLSEGSVNPYIIAFAAIIAGLMSWQCLELIESVGQRWLQSARRQDLWATGVDAALQRRGRSLRALADQIGRSMRQIERWRLYRDRVTPEMQDRMTTWLDATRTELFSDELPQQPPEPLPRLAKDLAAALKDSGRSAVVLARQAGVDQPEVEAWIKREKAVPPDVQDLIAGWLDQPLDELFDDPAAAPVPPAAAPVPPAAAPAATVDLAAALILKGQSEQTLCEQLGISIEVVRGWLAGAQAVPSDWRPKIADWLGMKEAEIGWR